MRKELTKKEKENLLQMNHLLEREIAKWPEWRGLVDLGVSFDYTTFRTKSADYYSEKSDKISLNHHLANTYILSAMNVDFTDNRIPSNYKMTVDIHPFQWRPNPSKGILQFESEIAGDNRISKRVEDDDLLDWVRTEMKKKATEFDNACKFIESHEDKFREWAEMQKQANIFYNKIQKNFVAELKANGDFQ
jgi:hypothetical protein